MSQTPESFPVVSVCPGGKDAAIRVLLGSQLQMLLDLLDGEKKRPKIKLENVEIVIDRAQS